MANLPNGCSVNPVSIMDDVEDPFGHHLNQRYLKSGEKWQSYLKYTNGRLGDSSVYYWGESVRRSSSESGFISFVLSGFTSSPF